jgi:hypothetical protein
MWTRIKAISELHALHEHQTLAGFAIIQEFRKRALQSGLIASPDLCLGFVESLDKIIFKPSDINQRSLAGISLLYGNDSMVETSRVG